MLAEEDLPTYKRVRENNGKAGIEKIVQLFKDFISEFSLWHLVYFQIGLVIGRASLSQQLLPFGLAFVGLAIYQQLYKNERLSRTIFFIFSIYVGNYTVLGWSWLLAKYLLAGLLFSLIAIYLVRKKQRISKRSLAILNGGIILVIEVINIVLTTPTLYYNLIFSLGAVLVGVLTLVLIEGLSPLIWVESKQQLKRINILALLIMVAVFNIGLPEISLGVINVSRAFSNLLIMLIAMTGGGIVATIVGLVVGLFYSMSNPYIIEVTGLYALAGLISGNFKEEGKPGVIVGFSLTALLYTVFLIDINNINSIIGETLLAGGVLILIPERFIHLLKNWIPDLKASFREEVHNESQQEVVNQVNQVADVFSELANTFQQTSAVNSGQSDNLEELLSIITNQVCVDCEFYNICWEQEFFMTYQQAIEVLSIAEQEGRIEAKRLNKIMQGNCQLPAEFSEAINRFLEKYETNNFWQQKLKDSKEVIGNQLGGVSELLKEMATNLKVKDKLHNNLDKTIQNKLESRGIFVNQLTVTESQNEFKISLTKEACQGKQECTNRIIPILNQILDQNFKVDWSRCGGSTGAQNCSLKILPDTKYWVQTGIAQVSPDKEGVSGDDYKVVELDNSQEVVSILSDGMGRGQRAALESKTTVKLLEKLITAGFDKKLAIKTVNSTLLLRSTEEVFATLDMNAIDCYTGRAEFIKIGSAPTFIKRNNREIELVRSSSLPIGIIDNIDIELTQRSQLSAGDMVVMVTDGILDSQEEETKQEKWMTRLLRNNLINDPQSLAEYILQQAQESKLEISDDMTVLVTKLNGYQNK